MNAEMTEVTETAAPAKKKPGRPPKKIAQAVATQGIAPTAEQWADMMAVLRSNKDADLENSATIHARAMKKALRPENEIAPDVSAYNPQGEHQFPRPKPTQIYMLGPFPLASPGDYFTSTWTELELLNQLKPGDYIVTKSDGTTVKASVKTEYESNGTKPYKTVIQIPMGDQEAMQNWVPLTQLLSEIVLNETPEKSYARMQAIIDRQTAELAALRATA